MDVEADTRGSLHGKRAPPPLLKAVDKYVEARCFARLLCVADPRIEEGPAQLGRYHVFRILVYGPRHYQPMADGTDVDVHIIEPLHIKPDRMSRAGQAG